MDSHFFILLQAILRLILLCKAKGRSGKILDIVCTFGVRIILLLRNLPGYLSLQQACGQLLHGYDIAILHARAYGNHRLHNIYLLHTLEHAAHDATCSRSP